MVIESYTVTHDPYPWAADLPALYAQIWARLVRGVNDRRAPTRHPTLATVSSQGMPKARTVVLRAANPKAHTLVLHTDRHAQKIQDLLATPWAALHVWDETARLQTRIECEASILTGPDAALEWERASINSRLSYGNAPISGTPIEAALAYTKTADRASFAVIRLNVFAIEALHLGADHRRARFESSDDWQGQWLVP